MKAPCYEGLFHLPELDLLGEHRSALLFTSVIMGQDALTDTFCQCTLLDWAA